MAINASIAQGEMQAAASKPLFVKVLSIAFGASDTYVTGGFTFDPADYLPAGATLLHAPEDVSGYLNTYVAYYNASTGKVQLYVRATGAEVASAFDMHAADVKLRLIAY